MKILVLDPTECHLDFAIRAQEWDHEVRLWIPTDTTGKRSIIGDGLVDKVDDWQKYMDWADMIVVMSNSRYRDDIEPYFKKGYPIFGCNKEASELELNRGKGQEVLEKYGVKTIPFETFSNYDKAIAYVMKEKRGFVSKPWGGTSDKGLSFVAKSPDDMIHKLRKWKDEGKLKGEFMLQEFVPGTEIAVGGWFGPGGWSRSICENFEDKSFMNEGLGGNTGEQGTALRYVTKSKLFDEVLEPVTDYLHKVKYVGYCDVNTMINEKGEALPLEFTMRFGDPTFHIQQALHEDDFADAMANLLEGKDTIRTSKDIAVGVVLTHGDWPHSNLTGTVTEGYPIRGISTRNVDSLHFAMVMDGVGPAMVGGEIEDVSLPVTAGDYVMICTGTGPSISVARGAAYRVAWAVSWASNKMMRTDIGKRLKDELPKIQKFGYAKGFNY